MGQDLQRATGTRFVGCVQTLALSTVSLTTLCCRGADAFGSVEAAWEAISLYTKLMETGSSVKLLLNRSSAFIRLGKSQEALSDLKQVSLWQTLPSCLTEARTRSLQAVALDPNSVKALYRLGIHLAAAGLASDAEDVLSTAAKLAPRSKSVQRALASAKTANQVLSMT